VKTCFAINRTVSVISVIFQALKQTSKESIIKVRDLTGKQDNRHHGFTKDISHQTDLINFTISPTPSSFRSRKNKKAGAQLLWTSSIKMKSDEYPQHLKSFF